MYQNCNLIQEDTQEDSRKNIVKIMHPKFLNEVNRAGFLNNDSLMTSLTKNKIRKEVTMVNGTLKDLSTHRRVISDKLQPKSLRFQDKPEILDSSKSQKSELQFRRIEANGHQIEGTWKRDKLHGKVQIKYKGGQYFIGKYQFGIKKQGFLKLKDGTEYSGTFDNNNLHGNGTIKDPQGRIISARWKYGQPEGQVIIYYPTSQVYVGEIKNLKKHGKGKLKLKNNAQYIGQFENGFIHGYGEYFQDGTLIAKGYWEENVFQPFQQQMLECIKKIVTNIVIIPTLKDVELSESHSELRVSIAQF